MLMRVATEQPEAKKAREELTEQMNRLSQPLNPSLDDWGYGGDISGLGIPPMRDRRGGDVA